MESIESNMESSKDMGLRCKGWCHDIQDNHELRCKGWCHSNDEQPKYEFEMPETKYFSN